jgi:hypothetical protein
MGFCVCTKVVVRNILRGMLNGSAVPDVLKSKFFALGANAGRCSRRHSLGQMFS